MIASRIHVPGRSHGAKITHGKLHFLFPFNVDLPPNKGELIASSLTVEVRKRLIFFSRTGKS